MEQANCNNNHIGTMNSLPSTIPIFFQDLRTPQENSIQIWGPNCLFQYCGWLRIFLSYLNLWHLSYFIKIINCLCMTSYFKLKTRKYSLVQDLICTPQSWKFVICSLGCLSCIEKLSLTSNLHFFVSPQFSLNPFLFNNQSLYAYSCHHI